MWTPRQGLATPNTHVSTLTGQLHGILVDQSTIYRWVQHFLPLFGYAARRYREPVGPDWRVD